MSTTASSIFLVDFIVGNNKRNWTSFVGKFEWASMIDGGFTARIQLLDPNFAFQDELLTEEYLSTARTEPLWVKFRVKWDGGDATPYKYGIVADLGGTGDSSDAGKFEFIILDPVSYFLTKGNGSGKVYEGKIGGAGGVLDQVLSDYIPPTITISIGGIETTLWFTKKISDTTDSPSQYWMMRQDPKTFITSLLDWSASVTKKKTSWQVVNGITEFDNKLTYIISIEEDYTNDLRFPSMAAGVDEASPLIFTYGRSNTQIISDVNKWDLTCDNLLINLCARLQTSGISAVSGQYLDAQTDNQRQFIQVDDSNTINKTNAVFGPDRGFTKPGIEDGGSTHIMAIPEFNAGDLGKPYREYIDGRARRYYMDMLRLLMRIRLTVRGEPRLHNSLDLGRSYCILQWPRPTAELDGQVTSSFIDGHWMLYGWHHTASHVTGQWTTQVYLARLDYNALAKPGWSQR